MPTPLEIARSQIGFREGPHNQNPYSHPIYANHPYCAQFVSWCYRRAGTPLPEMQAPDLDGFAGCSIGLSYARQHGWEVLVPLAGDLVFFQLDTDPAADHVGFVSAVQADGTIVTVEGNTGTPQGVHRCERPMSSVMAFVRVPAPKPGPCWAKPPYECPV